MFYNVNILLIDRIYPARSLEKEMHSWFVVKNDFRSDTRVSLIDFLKPSFETKS